jgi:Gnt-I system low-affinity gluconate transporter
MPIPIIGTLIGIALLLLLILRFKLPAFLSLLIASIVAGLIAGQDGQAVIDSVINGMGGTLGFVATVVGLGAIFGAILEYCGGAQAVASYLLKTLGEKRAPLSMVITGFVIAIPVFFDVGFIILVPLIYALQKKTGKSLLLYAIPLLAGLAATHAFIPPTPGPIAVADILGADLGWVIVLGVIVGIPTVLISGLWYGRYIANRMYLEAPDTDEGEEENLKPLPPVAWVLAIIGLPILLIVFSTLIKSESISIASTTLSGIIIFLGHPIVALIIANLIAWYVLGMNYGASAKELSAITAKSMAPAGTIILLTGAGGVFKQILVDTGAGKLIAESLLDLGLPIIVFAFLASAMIRIAQGSATVAMITGASLAAPLLAGNDAIHAGQLAAITIAIAAGASILSHVNDSGFWLVKQYLGMTEKQAFNSWTVMTTILALCGFIGAGVLFLVL